MKRKHTEEHGLANGKATKATKVAKTESHIHSNFHAGLFDVRTVKHFKTDYRESEPYKHTVIPQLMSDTLLRSVREEILENIHFTPKETDIYKIHQSGDLANLSGLPSSALVRLPSLLKLRDSLYSAEFREWTSQVSGAGALSGKKTDMAVNVYAPGCHLLCHDDVIGSRRVSYILYLTNPDKPWREEWGGALRLYPTKLNTDTNGKETKSPDPMWTKSIPPAWNQLSFFAVQPGESFHDVEEVYKREEQEAEDDGGRIRMAISGWFHIPQEGEEGFVPGLEEKLAERSSLQQLQGKNEAFDLPQLQWREYDGESKEAKAEGDEDDEDDAELSEQDLEFLLKYMTPHYLTPDTVDELSTLFADESSLQLANFLSKKFSRSLRDWITAHDHSEELEVNSSWTVARPPYKQRYLYRHPQINPFKATGTSSPYDMLVENFLPSLSFRKWLSLATNLSLGQSDILARRFRKSLDYSLATAYEKDDVQLEWCLNATPSKGWGAGEQEDQEQADGTAETSEDAEANGSVVNNEKPKNAEEEPVEEEDNVGGYEIYMAGDDSDDDDDGSHDGVEIPSGPSNPSATGAGNRRNAKRKKDDPAVYKASADDEDDGILFSNPASWNTMSIVLRDKGTLKFVKYVSKAAQGDRWDFTGSVEVLDDGEDNEDGDEEGDVEDESAIANGTTNGHAHHESEDSSDEDEDASDEEEWNGFED